MKGGKEGRKERKKKEKKRSSVKYQGRAKALMSGARLLIRRVWASSHLIGKVLFKFFKRKKKQKQKHGMAQNCKSEESLLSGKCQALRDIPYLGSALWFLQ